MAGNPIAHSLSPLMHNAAFRRENVNAMLLPLKTRALDDLLTVVRELPLAGVAVTMPLKQEVLPHLANMDPLTGRIGACNTLRTGADGKLYGFNTDVAGVVRPLEKRIGSRARALPCLAREERRGLPCSDWWNRAPKFLSSTAPMRRPWPWPVRPKPSR